MFAEPMHANSSSTSTTFACTVTRRTRYITTLSRCPGSRRSISLCWTSLLIVRLIGDRCRPGSSWSRTPGADQDDLGAARRRRPQERVELEVVVAAGLLAEVLVLDVDVAARRRQRGHQRLVHLVHRRHAAQRRQHAARGHRPQHADGRRAVGDGRLGRDRRDGRALDARAAAREDAGAALRDQAPPLGERLVDACGGGAADASDGVVPAVPAPAHPQRVVRVAVEAAVGEVDAADEGGHDAAVHERDGLGVVRPEQRTGPVDEHAPGQRAAAVLGLQALEQGGTRAGCGGSRSVPGRAGSPPRARRPARCARPPRRPRDGRAGRRASGTRGSSGSCPSRSMRESNSKPEDQHAVAGDEFVQVSGQFGKVGLAVDERHPFAVAGVGRTGRRRRRKVRGAVHAVEPSQSSVPTRSFMSEWHRGRHGGRRRNPARARGQVRRSDGLRGP